ncbi:prepilin peptidase [Agromyces seonyuensis]|uniref:Prepilin leader peptidase/N-methyltransferase n=1 Tax=Agromyces seonyuensis TaxID=2662446 RepID=A0A6I4P1Z7_9MICO|nr:A24 family peptidase [Agromyces seonyuensis]MWB99592.1 prepilin peptidase [Agromyces seonyuensis]
MSALAQAPGLAGILIAFAGLGGLAIGSFLNVVVARVPEGRSVVAPASACPQCGSAIRARDNVPVVSWMLLGARCRDCAAPISARYPLVEAFTGLAFAGLAAAVVLGTVPTATTAGGVADLLLLLVFAGVSIPLALIDLDAHRLPDRIVIPGMVAVGALVVVAGALSGEPEAIGRALIGGAALFALYFLLAIVSNGGMGAGDIKLAALIGLVLGRFGWAELIVGAFAAFVLGGLAAVALLVARRAKRGSGIPFGPWMLAGAWIGILAGAPIAAAYLASAGLG